MRVTCKLRRRLACIGYISTCLPPSCALVGYSFHQTFSFGHPSLHSIAQLVRLPPKLFNNFTDQTTNYLDDKKKPRDVTSYLRNIVDISWLVCIYLTLSSILRKFISTTTLLLKSMDEENSSLLL